MKWQRDRGTKNCGGIKGAQKKIEVQTMDKKRTRHRQEKREAQDTGRRWWNVGAAEADRGIFLSGTKLMLEH